MRQMTKYEAVTYALNALVPLMELPDRDANQLKGYFPEWKNLMGSAAKEGRRFRHNGSLYRVMQAHRFSPDWIPGHGTEALYERIPEEYEGTWDDPIAYTGNMRLEPGKYYVQEGVTYRCIRDTAAPVYDSLAALATAQVEMIQMLLN